MAHFTKWFSYSFAIEMHVNTLQGNYLAGVYYPDKTRVGWWKNGYPEYFARVLNAPNWIGIDVEIDGVQLDLHHYDPINFRRELNMRQGYLERFFVAWPLPEEQWEPKMATFTLEESTNF